jgi:hypothetical protein
VEIEIKESKRGPRITGRRKRSYAGQQIVTLSGTLAHNVVFCAKKWLSSAAPKQKRYGARRMVRDVMAVSGFLETGKADAIKRVVLSGASTLARATVKAMRAMLKAEHVAVILGETQVKPKFCPKERHDALVSHRIIKR